MKLNGFQVSGQGVTSSAVAARRFTPAQANAALPLVQRIVQEIVQAFHEAHTLHRKLHALEDDDDGERAECFRRRRDAAVRRVRRLREELEGIGCELKDAESGLVDFPARRNGRQICLCWKLGEPEVGHWHDRDAGFSNRRPITRT